MEKIRTVETSKGLLEYTDKGEGDVVICIHGAMGGFDQSEILGETVAPCGYRYISISRPGYLGTDLSVGKSPEEQGDLISELLDILKIKEAIVMAISGGGYSAIQFAAEHPEKCKALLLFSTTGGPNDEKIPFAFNILVFMAKFSFLAKTLKRATEKNLEKNLQKSINDKDILKKTIKNKEVMALFRRLSVGMFDNISLRIPGTKNDILQTQSREYPLEKIKAPTLIVHGEKDKVVPFEKHGKRLHASISGSELLAIPEGEHVTIFTHRAEVQRTVKDFLKRVN